MAEKNLKVGVMWAVWAAVALGASGVVAQQAPAPAGERFTIDHALELVEFSEPRISPDGARVLFTRAELDWAENERPERLYIANSDGSDVRPFTAEKDDARPRWSPDGRWVAFLREVGEDEEKTRQLFVIRTDGGEARQLTKHVASIRSYEWAPDASRLYFVAADSLTKEEKEAKKKGADAIFVNEGPNGQGRGSYSNLWYVEAVPDTAASQPLTEGERIIGDFAVAPDGRSVAFTVRDQNHRNDAHLSEIAVVDVASRRIRRLTSNEAPESSVLWSPDSRSLSYIAPDLETWELDQGDLYVLDVASGAVRQLTSDFGPEIQRYEWAPDGRAIDFVALDRTTTSVHRLDVGSGGVTRLAELPGVIGPLTFSRDHSRVAYTFSTPISPQEVYTARLPQFAATRLTDANAAVRALSLAAAEPVRWRSEDGLEIEGLLYHQRGRNGAAGAMVLEIHGGPAGVFTQSFDADAQLLAANGYAVLQPNVRGSSGYGDAFLRGNMRDIGGGDYEDVMTGVDAMIARGVAHPDSLAVKGWSYGGILGGWTLTRTDRFKAASLGAMVADWPSEFGVGFNYDVSRWYLGGDPWRNRAMWLDRSAYSHMDRIRTPTILFHGDEDETDTPGQSMNFHMALRHFGVPTRFIRFPREGHGIREPRHLRTRLVEELRWLERYVRGNDDWTAPERVAVGGSR